MNNTSRTHKLASFIITFSIIGILIMAGPANAFNLSVSAPTNPTPYQGDTTSFDATFDVNTNERVPLSNLELVLSNGQICKFSPNGNPISGCNGITISVSSSNVNSGYGYNSFSGYGYGYQSGYGYGYNTYQPYSYGYGYGYAGYGYGYGYGYGTQQGARTYTIDINTSVFPIGTLTYYIRTVINSNTFVSGSESITILDADLNPTVTLSTPVNGALMNNVVVNFTSNDDLDATLTCDILDNNISIHTNTFTNGNNSVSLSLLDGTHDLQVRCTDSSTQTTYSNTNTITLDSVAPSITLTSPANNFQTNNVNVTFDIGAFDSTATVDCNIYVDSILTKSYIDLNSGSSIQGSSLFSEGAHTWNTECQDEAGNWNISETRTFTIDLTVPSILLTSPVDNFQTNNPNVLFDITAFDSTATVDCTVKVDNNSIYSYIDLNNGSAIQASNTSFTDGIHSWNTECVDEVNNYNVSETRSFTIDTVMPNITSVGPSGEFQTTTSAVQLSAVTSENATCRYSLTDTVYNNMTQNFTLGNLTNHASDNLAVFASSSYNLFVRCEDSFGNQNNESKIISFSVASPASRSSSGGGAGVPWSCGGWSACVNGERVQTCTYLDDARVNTRSCVGGSEEDLEFESLSNPTDSNSNTNTNTNSGNSNLQNNLNEEEQEQLDTATNEITGAVVGGSSNNIWYLVAALGVVVLLGGSYFFIKRK